jgi:hypothetical protein
VDETYDPAFLDTLERLVRSVEKSPARCRAT